jgi:uncharacterized protein YjbI with pentapeptide repeats
MRIATDETVLVGWTVSKIRPPQYAATFVVKATFKLHPGQSPTQDGVELEGPTGDVHWDDDDTKSLKYPADFVPMKPRADVMLVGSAHAPGGVPAKSLKVRFKVGNFSKSIEVIGSRAWEGMLSSKTTPPESFTSMPLRYENTIGGPSEPRNPVGQNYKTTPPTLLLPQKPKELNRDLSPACFGPIARSWAPRNENLGTYNKKWVQTRWPWLPEDFDWAHFNAAPRDQQLDVFLRGDEEIVLENLHPIHSDFRTRLPGLRARCFFHDKLPDGTIRFREVPLKLDTLWINTDEEKLILVWRGDAEVRTLRARELLDMYACTEPLALPPGTAEQHRAAFLKRFAEEVDPEDEKRQAAIAMAWAEFDADMSQMKSEFAELDKEAESLMAEADREIAGQAAAMIADGMDPKLFGAPVLLDPTTSAVDEFKALTTAFAEVPHGEMKFDAGTAMSAIGESEAALKSAEAEQAEFDRLFDVTFPEEFVWTRERVVAAQPGDLQDANLCNLDLSGLDLSRVNLAGSQLAKANLAKTKLAGANLAGADLREADLTGADLTGARLDDADFEKAILAEAKFAGASIRNTDFAKLDLSGADFSNCSGRAVNFSEAKLTGAKFHGAQLEVADFSKSVLAKAEFHGANLKAAQFETIEGPGIVLDGADIAGIHASEGCNFTGGSFKRCKGAAAIFEEAILDGADFSRSILTRGQFTDASLRNATLDRCDLVSAAFDDTVMEKAVVTNSNLLRANFDRANLTEADFRGSNLYEAGFWEATTDKANFRNANLKGTLLS